MLYPLYFIICSIVAYRLPSVKREKREMELLSWPILSYTRKRREKGKPQEQKQ
jgi:hypothetical protein